MSGRTVFMAVVAIVNLLAGLELRSSADLPHRGNSPLAGDYLPLYQEVCGEEPDVAWLCAAALFLRTEAWLIAHEPDDYLALANEFRLPVELKGDSTARLPERPRVDPKVDNPNSDWPGKSWPRKSGYWFSFVAHLTHPPSVNWFWQGNPYFIKTDEMQPFPPTSPCREYTWTGDANRGELVLIDRTAELLLEPHSGSYVVSNVLTTLPGIYHVADDIVIMAYETYPERITLLPEMEDPYYLGKLKPAGIKPPGFKAPMSLSLFTFHVLLRISKAELGPAQTRALAKEVLPKREPETRLYGKWVCASREEYYGSLERLAELYNAIYLFPYEDDRLPVLHKGVCFYRGSGYSPYVRFAMQNFGHLYPLKNWTISGDTIYTCPTWIGKAQPIWKYKATRTTKYGGEIDLYPLDPQGKPLPQVELRGIYYILDDFVFICYNDWRTSGLPKEERPARFERTPQKVYTLEVLRRIHDVDLPREVRQQP